LNGLLEHIIAGIISGIIAGLIAVATWWYISFKRLRKNLLGMVKDEVERNKKTCKNIKDLFIDTPTSSPFKRLISINRDSSWTKIIEYRGIDQDLILNISELYGFYDMFNRTLDDLRSYRIMRQNINIKGASVEIKRQYNEIKKRSDEVISEIAQTIDC